MKRNKNQHEEVTLEKNSKLALENGYNLISNEYVNSKTKLIFDDKYGYKYSLKYSGLIDAKRPFHVHNQFTIENIKLFLKINKIELVLLSNEYINQDSKMLWECKCGNTFYASWSKVKNSNKRQCNLCSKKITSNKRIKDFSCVKKELIKKGFVLLDEYKGLEYKYNIVDKDGYKYYTTIKSCFSYKPNRFYINNPYSIFNINNYIKINNLKCLCLEKEWQGCIKEMEFLCSCGRKYKTTWSSFTSQKATRCKRCNGKTSKLELLIEEYLCDKNIEYIREKTFKGCKHKGRLRFDFYLPNCNTCIEVQGIQHYKPVGFDKDISDEDIVDSFNGLKIRDKIKKDYCKNNSIGFIEISYKEIKTNKYKNKLNHLV